MRKYLKDKTARLDIRLSHNQKKLIQYEAIQQQKTVSELIRNLIDNKDEKEKN